MAKILVIDDEVDICMILDRFLTKKGFDVTVAHRGADGMKEVKKAAFDLVISDFRLPDMNGLELLKQVKSENPMLKVIIITGYSDIRMAVELIKYGAVDYVTKPLYPEELLSLINDTLADESPTDEGQGNMRNAAGNVSTATVPLRRAAGKLPYIVGSSRLSKDVYQNIELIAPTPMSVIISGETGTGKEYVAKEIHRLSNRSDAPFVAIDCGALPKDIAGSEFFGHEKGSFTGAVKDKDGKFKYADGGTLFLDEIGNLSYEIQVKLLRVLQERKYTRIGGDRDISVDVRIVTATNEDLKKAVQEGRFREDLYYRLNEFNINLSPIRNRFEDVEDFVGSFITQANEQLGRKVTSISDETKDKFRKYSWPGNLRELRNVIKRSVLLTDGETIELGTLPEEIVYHSDSNGSSDDSSLKGVALEAEKDRILKVLAQTGNNKSKAAKVLNIDRKTLYNKLKNYDL